MELLFVYRSDCSYRQGGEKRGERHFERSRSRCVADEAWVGVKDNVFKDEYRYDLLLLLAQVIPRPLL